MRFLILLLGVILLLAACPIGATELVARQGDDEVRLFESPCVHAGTLGLIKPEAREKFKKAAGRFSGQMFYGCWRPVGDSAVLVWEDGDQGIIPVTELKPDHGA